MKIQSDAFNFTERQYSKTTLYKEDEIEAKSLRTSTYLVNSFRVIDQFNWSRGRDLFRISNPFLYK